MEEQSRWVRVDLVVAWRRWRSRGREGPKGVECDREGDEPGEQCGDRGDQITCDGDNRYSGPTRGGVPFCPRKLYLTLAFLPVAEWRRSEYCIRML